MSTSKKVIVFFFFNNTKTITNNLFKRNFIYHLTFHSLAKILKAKIQHPKHLYFTAHTTNAKQYKDKTVYINILRGKNEEVTDFFNLKKK